MQNEVCSANTGLYLADHKVQEVIAEHGEAYAARQLVCCLIHTCCCFWLLGCSVHPVAYSNEHCSNHAHRTSGKPLCISESMQGIRTAYMYRLTNARSAASAHHRVNTGNVPAIVSSIKVCNHKSSHILLNSSFLTQLEMMSVDTHLCSQLWT